MTIMRDWQSDLFNTVEDFATGVEDLMTEVSASAMAILEQLVDRSIEVSEEIATDMTDSLSEVLKEVSTEFSVQTQVFLDADLEAFLNMLLHPLTMESIEDWINITYSANVSQYTSVPVEPHPLCADCKYFHGQAYNEISLVCGMHPYGIVDGQSSCDDRAI
jgi:hypothetical protein